jgi:hypothetical protein
MVNESVRYGVRWFGVVGLSMALSECDIKLDTYIYTIYIYIYTLFYDARNHEPKT